MTVSFKKTARGTQFFCNSKSGVDVGKQLLSRHKITIEEFWSFLQKQSIMVGAGSRKTEETTVTNFIFVHQTKTF